MLNTALENVTATKIAASVSAANTAAASFWTAVPVSEGTVLLVLSVGIITGTLDFTFTTNTSASDTGATSITPINGAIAQITTSNDDAVYVAQFPATQLRGYVKVIGTVGTGPALISYTMVTTPKYS